MREMPFFAGEEARYSLLVFLFFLCVFIITIWGSWERVLPAGEEALLAESAKEVLVYHDLMPLRFAGDPVYGIPPLAPWLVAICFRLFGVNDFSARLAFVVLSICASLVMLAAGREASRDFTSEESNDGRSDPARRPEKWRSLPEAAGALAAMTLAATPLFGRYAPHVTTAIPFAFFASLAFLGWLRIPERSSGYALWAVGILGAILSVGAAGMLLIVGAAVASIVQSGRRLAWRKSSFVVSTVASVAIGAIFLVPASIGSGGFSSSPILEPFSSIASLDSSSSRAFALAAANVWLRSLPWAIPAAMAAARTLFFTREKRRRSLVGEIDSSILAFIVCMFVPLALRKNLEIGMLLPVAPFVAILSTREITRWFAMRHKDAVENVWTLNKIITAVFCLLMLLVISTLMSLRPRTEDPIREIALAARRITPAGASIGNYRQSTKLHRARLLFYGDRKLEEPILSPEEVLKVFAADEGKVFFASEADAISLRDTEDIGERMRVLYAAGGLVLFGSQHIPGDECQQKN